MPGMTIGVRGSHANPFLRGGRCLVASLMVATLVLAGAGPAFANSHDEASSEQVEQHPSQQRDRLDLEDQDKGYTTEYFFSMSRGIMQSTLDPALKPAVLLLTVPLDIAFLPFAAIGGFLR